MPSSSPEGGQETCAIRTRQANPLAPGLRRRHFFFGFGCPGPSARAKNVRWVKLKRRPNRDRWEMFQVRRT